MRIAYLTQSYPPMISGFLTAPGDITSFSDRIITLLNNPKKARMMDMYGHALAEEYDIH